MSSLKLLKTVLLPNPLMKNNVRNLWAPKFVMKRKVRPRVFKSFEERMEGTFNYFIFILIRKVSHYYIKIL